MLKGQLNGESFMGRITAILGPQHQRLHKIAPEMVIAVRVIYASMRIHKLVFGSDNVKIRPMATIGTTHGKEEKIVNPCFRPNPDFYDPKVFDGIYF